VGILTAAGAVAPALAASPVPRVALIVGPVGSLTSTYRSLANAAAAEAQAAGAEVVKVYSPNATWSAVQRATNGASIVVYLGHGNGWPSPYRSSLYPPTQNGFGLNPVAGVDDSAHQYFGEASVRSLHLAANAVVVLSHLCYASGNSEPGLAEGTQDQAIARVDNYAAGFIRAGAKAVVAEGHFGPAYYVRQLLRTSLSIERIWQAAPSAHGNTFSVISARSNGYTERLDPDRSSGGYYRSLVSRGVTASAVRAGATGTFAGVISQQSSEPSLASRGIRFGTVSLRDLPITDGHTVMTLPIKGNGARQIPSGARVGVRWDPILLDAGASTGLVPDPVSDSSGMPVGNLTAPGASAAPDASGGDPLSVDLVAPEQLGAMVEVGHVKQMSSGLRMDVTYPNAPGLYRLVPSLHTPSGIAYDAATQSLLTPVLVRVGGPVAVAYGAPDAVTMAAGESASLQVRVVNAGSESWDGPSSEPPAGGAAALLYWLRTGNAPARLVGTWVSVADNAVPDPVSTVLDAANAAPGGDAMVDLDLVGPAIPGDYLLLVDVDSPAHGALSALGSKPALVRVTVAAVGTGAAPVDGGGIGPVPSITPGTLPGTEPGTGSPATSPGPSDQPTTSPPVVLPSSSPDERVPSVTLPGVLGPIVTLPGEAPAPTNAPGT
jgi:hypothetical protein